MAKKLEQSPNVQRRMKQFPPFIGEKQRQLKRVKINVGTPWPDGIEVSTGQTPEEVKRHVIVGMSCLFGVVFLAFAAYGIIVSDASVVKRTMAIVQCGFATVGIWAIGKKYLSRSKEQVYDEKWGS